MWLILSKLLPLLFLPVGLWFWGTLLAVLIRKKSRKFAKFFLVMSFVQLVLFSLPIVSDNLVLSLENRYPSVPVDQAPTADVIVLLGGGLMLENKHRPRPELGLAGDRLLLTYELYTAGKAPLIWVASEYMPNQSMTDQPDETRTILTRWGVPENAIHGENQSRTTHENAALFKIAADKFGWTSALLVTSANHLPRAMQHFENYGISPTPMAANHWISYEETTGISAFLPQAEALNDSSKILREYLGMLVYSLVAKAPARS